MRWDSEIAARIAKSASEGRRNASREAPTRGRKAMMVAAAVILTRSKGVPKVPAKALGIRDAQYSKAPIAHQNIIEVEV